MKKLLGLLLVFVCATAVRAQMDVGPFVPIYKGIDLARGTNYPDATIPRRQVVRCLRIDLTDPAVQVFTTPKASNYVANSVETYSLSVSNFLKRNGLKVATDANFYNAQQGGPSPSSEGVGCNVEGMMISTGIVVSAADNSRFVSLLFTTNKEPTFVWTNRPPGVSTVGVYTAVSGYYPLLTNGLNLWANPVVSNSLFSVYTPGDFSIHQSQPRTAFGVSQDKRFLFLMTIDGRQNFSDGAYDSDTAAWLLAFGAADALNMDGGGSTSMYMADCGGNPIALNHSSYINTVNPPRERYIGAHFGVFSQPLSTFIYNIGATSGSTTAVITWNTESNATSQVEYGLTTSYGSTSLLDTTPVTTHTVFLSGLVPARQYYFRVLSTTPTAQYASECSTSFSTTNPGGFVIAYALTNDWKWLTDNLDGVNWRASDYPDGTWNHGPGTLWVDTRGGPQAGIPSPTSLLPINPATTYPYNTYYFRTHFNFPGDAASSLLTFTNYVDDGMAVYLNGVEVNRLNLSPTAVNSTAATGAYCSSGNATCPYVFSLTDNPNLRSGDNVVAVEVHNVVGANPSPDVTFAQTLSFPAPLAAGPGPVITNVVVAPGETNATITWQTIDPGSTQVQYGTNATLGLSTSLDATLRTNHSVTLTNLLPLTQYNFRLISSNGSAPFTYDGLFSTVPFYQAVLPITAVWRYTTNDLSTTNWTAPNYNDSGWPQGGGLLAVEDNPTVSPQTTLLPAAPSGKVFPTYYFRTHFNVASPLIGYSLLVSNFIDDGAVFYLNGTEVQRVRMPSGPIGYTSLANGCPLDNCDASTEVADVFRIGGDALANVVTGDNVLAAEVHQVTTNEVDVVFGSSIGVVRALASETKLGVSFNNGVLTISWTGSGLTLQNSGGLRETNTQWIDVNSGNVKTSPFTLTNPPTTMRFYRLRN